MQDSSLKEWGNSEAYNCTLCGFKYSTPGNLAVHIREVHVKGLYYCSTCGKVRPLSKRQDFHLVESHPCINKVGVFEVHVKKVSLYRARLTMKKLPRAKVLKSALNSWMISSQLAKGWMGLRQVKKFTFTSIMKSLKCGLGRTWGIILKSLQRVPFWQEKRKKCVSPEGECVPGSHILRKGRNQCSWVRERMPCNSIWEMTLFKKLRVWIVPTPQV